MGAEIVLNDILTPGNSMSPTTPPNNSPARLWPVAHSRRDREDIPIFQKTFPCSFAQFLRILIGDFTGYCHFQWRRPKREGSTS
jgi:hypothetical protein